MATDAVGDPEVQKLYQYADSLSEAKDKSQVCSPFLDLFQFSVPSIFVDFGGRGFIEWFRVDSYSMWASTRGSYQRLGQEATRRNNWLRSWYRGSLSFFPIFLEGLLMLTSISSRWMTLRLVLFYFVLFCFVLFLFFFYSLFF